MNRSKPGPTLIDLARHSDDAYRSHSYRWKGVEALRIDTSGATIIAFRGTEHNYRDILRDMRAVPWWFSEFGWCHSGFARGVRGIWPEILLAIYEDKIDPATLWFTGHSKGAAEATLAAVLTIQNFGKLGGLVTFGSPRIGFSLTSRLTFCSITRVVNGNDIVPRHPWALWGYRHVRPKYQIGQLGDRFEDHGIRKYIRNLEELS